MVEPRRGPIGRAGGRAPDVALRALPVDGSLACAGDGALVCVPGAARDGRRRQGSHEPERVLAGAEDSGRTVQKAREHDGELLADVDLFTGAELVPFHLPGKLGKSLAGED